MLAPRSFLTWAVAALWATSVLGCTTPPTPTTTPIPSGAATIAPSGDPVLKAILNGVDANSAAGVLASAPGTTATEVPVAGLTGWKIYNLVGSGRPVEMMLALAADGRVLRLSNVPANFVTISEGSPVKDATAAAARAADFLTISRDLAHLSYQVNSVTDLKWSPTLNADQQAIRQSVLSTFGDQVKAPVAVATASGWEAFVWRVEEDTLVLHRVTVTATGGLSDTSEVKQRNLPVVRGA